MMEDIDYKPFKYLNVDQCVEFMKEISKYVYLIYILDWSRHVCVTGKYLKNNPLNNWAFDNFPRNSIEL